jgi:uncharacterized protein YacL
MLSHRLCPQSPRGLSNVMREREVRSLIMDKLTSSVSFVLGAFIGFLVHRLLAGVLLSDLGAGVSIPMLIVLVAAGGLFGLSVFPVVFRGLRKATSKLEAYLQKVPTQDLVAGAFGAIIFLLIAVLLTLPFSQIPYIGVYLPIGLTLFMGYLGMQLAVKNTSEGLLISERPVSPIWNTPISLVDPNLFFTHLSILKLWWRSPSK